LLYTRSYAGHGSNRRVESSEVLHVYGWYMVYRPDVASA